MSKTAETLSDRAAHARGPAPIPVPAARLGAIYFAYFAYVGVHSPYFGLYLQSIGLVAWEIGLVLGGMQLARVFAPNFWAWLADRAGRHAFWLRICVALAALVFGAVFGITAFAPLFAVLVVHAFCAGGAVPLVEAITVSRLGSQIGRYGAIRMWGSIGFLIAVIAVGAQLDRWPVATLLLTIAASLLLVVGCTLVLPESAPPRAGAASESIVAILRRPRVRALLAASFLMAVAHGPLYSFFSIFLADAGYSKTAIGWLWAVGVLTEIAIFWWQPAWSRRIAFETMLLASLACAVVRFVATGWAVESGLAMLAAQILHGFTFGGYHVASIGLLSRELGPRTQVRGQAMFTSLAYGAGGMAGAFASGIAWDVIGPAWTFTAAAIAAAAGGAIALAIRAPRPR